jgi:hypothetical protein
MKKARINFDLSTDKKLCFSYGDEHFVYHTGMHFSILNWDFNYFQMLIQSYAFGISYEEVNGLFPIYKRLEIHLKNKLRKESQELCEQIKKARKFDYTAAEKRIARIALITN